MNSSQNSPNLLATLQSQDLSALTSTEIEEINKLIAITGNGCLEFLEICQILDYQWDEFGCDNQNLNWDNIGKFYNHPVWLLNGIFIEQDPLSMQLRYSLVDWIFAHKDSINSVVDYGGGFGTIARAIAAQSSNFLVDVYEPHPHNLAILKSTAYPNIKFINSINTQYDCLVSTDVLEHVADPLRVFATTIESVKLNGYLVISNHFAPTIKCHLPTTFHLVYTFDYFARLMGLSVLGTCPGTYATIYQKVVEKPFNWKLINKLAAISAGLYPSLRTIAKTKNNLRKLIS